MIYEFVALNILNVLKTTKETQNKHFSQVKKDGAKEARGKGSRIDLQHMIYLRVNDMRINF